MAGVAVAAVAHGDAIEAVEPVVGRFGHPVQDDLGERLTPKRAVALAPLQAIDLYLVEHILS